jgi:hypothetical protein
MSSKCSALGLTAMVVMAASALTIHPVGAVAKQTVSIALGSSKVKTGQPAHVTGKVSPAASGKPIRLQQFYGNAWHGYKAQTLTSKSTYDFVLKFTKAGVYKLRVASPHAFSKAVTLSVVAPRTPTPPPPRPPVSPR